MTFIHPTRQHDTSWIFCCFRTHRDTRRRCAPIDVVIKRVYVTCWRFFVSPKGPPWDRHRRRTGHGPFIKTVEIEVEGWRLACLPLNKWLMTPSIQSKKHSLSLPVPPRNLDLNHNHNQTPNALVEIWLFALVLMFSNEWMNEIERRIYTEMPLVYLWHGNGEISISQ